MDFTINKYKALIASLQSEGYYFSPFYEFLTIKVNKKIVLRHDVDLLPQNSLRFAKIQNELGIEFVD